MDGRDRAARAVAARRGELGLTQQELAEAAGVDLKTIGSLERRGRWPIARTRSAIEKALDWPSGEMERIAHSEEEPDLVPPQLRVIMPLISQTLPPARAARLVAAIEAAYRGDLASPGESSQREDQAG